MIAIQKSERLTSSFVVMTSIVGALSCAYLLYSDVYLRRVLVNGLELAGTLSERTLTVQRKLGDRLIWDPIDSNESLYWNDSIQTLPQSSAKIKLKDGGEISLGESSLVILERTDSKLSLNIKSGQLVVDSDIQVNGLDLSRGGGKVSLQVDGGGGLTATKTSLDGFAKQYVVDSSGRVIEKDVVVSLMSPEPLAQIYVEQATSTTSFKWASRPQFKKQEIEIASDKNFKHVVSRQDVSEQATVDVSLESGFYYWRLIVSDGKTTENSETRSFTIQQIRAPELVSPAPNQKVIFEGQNPLVEFQWKGLKSANRYTLQVSDSPNFENIIATQDSTTNYLKTSKIPAGHYMWRVLAHFGSVTKASDAWAMDFEKIDVVSALVAPQLVSPINEGEMDLLKTPGARWNWAPVDGAKTYKFRLYKVGASKAKPIVDVALGDFEYAMKDLSDGNYRWTVSAIDGLGRESKPSEQTFSVVHGSQLDAPAFEMNEVQ